MLWGKEKYMKIIVAAAVAWFIAQVLKLIISFVENKTIDWSLVTASGGMPSSHTSFVIAATTMIGRVEGMESSIFALGVVLSLVVMYDAVNVRRAVGHMGQTLNEIINNINRTGKLNVQNVKEILGHTPLQVAAGFVLGVAVGFLMF
ncbi:MAG: divergent PAP2 family protein [Lachnospiraceae bacterium]|nr:divergent PAP2 family protein [Lachnospiraceae bacterium]